MRAYRSSPVVPMSTWSWHLRNSELDGQQAEDLLHEVGITVNRNAVPFDPRPPMVTSGLRIGTSALASRGLDSAAFTEVADIIGEALAAGKNADTAALRKRVDKIAADFPLYEAWRTGSWFSFRF